jgi:hypothetical protein
MKILEVKIRDKFDKFHYLKYRLYETDLADRWANLTDENLKNPNHSISTVINNRTEADVPEITNLLKEIVANINAEYDKHIESFDNIDNPKLNYLHEEFEIFGQRMDELFLAGKLTDTLTSNFFALNEYIHMCEDALITKVGSWGGFGILYDIHPIGLHLPIKPEDKLYLEPGIGWGKLYLGYNTLGKDWFAVAKDNDVDVVARNMIKPQKRFAAEAWLNFNTDYTSVQIASFFQEWVKTLPPALQKKIPYYNLNELSLGRFQIGELVIDQNFLKYDKDPLHWKAYRHECKKEWNHNVLTTFRTIESIRIYE